MLQLDVAIPYNGSLLTEEKWQGEVDGSVEFTYDNSFRIIKQKVNGVDSVAFVYDKDDLLTKAGSLSIVRNTQHGKPASDTFGGVIGTYTYDTFGNLATMTYRYSSDTLYSVTYTRDSFDRITRKVERAEGVTTTHDYTYDQAGRLFEVQRNDTLLASYFYDANGNRDSVVTPTGTTTGTYDDQDRLIDYGGGEYFYSPRGELTVKVEGEDTTRYTYDNLGNLVTVVLPNSDRIDYLIDGKNRRVGKQVNGATVKRWVYDGDLRPVAELDSTGNIETRFAYVERANVPEYMVKNGVTYRFITDHLGSLRLLVNTSTGSVAGRAEYDEWGNVTSSLDTLGIPFGFAGGIYEEATGLVRFGARDYDGEIGRWVSKDPLGFQANETNLFVYANDSPSDMTDPKGMLAQTQSLLHSLGGAVVSGAISATSNLASQFLYDYFSLTMRTEGIDMQTAAGRAWNDIDWGEVIASAVVGGITGPASGLRANLGLHSAHHQFIVKGINFGKHSHLQLNIWVNAVRNSHVPLRLMLPW